MEGKITYDDLLAVQKKLTEAEIKPKTFVLHPTLIALSIKAGYIRVDADKRMFITNNPYPSLSGSEVFSSENMEKGIMGYEVSKVIYDELENDNE